VYRHIPLFTIILVLSISVSRASLLPPEDGTLRVTAEKLARQEYSGAREAALQAPTGPARDFVLGVASYRLERWDEAERFLAGTPDAFPLLGDFALFYRATALTRLSRFDEALPLLRQLCKDYPQSPLSRSTDFLSADILFRKGDFQGALEAYLRCVETYSTGKDALRALYQAALCREKLGDREGAARDLRGIWLTYPGKEIASTAEADLTRLCATGVPIAPYSGEELFKRGCILFDLKKYREAVATFSLLTPESLSENLRGKLAFKNALALYHAKKNPEAEQALARLSSADSPYPEYVNESSYWYAKLLDRIGREKDALSIFQRLTGTRPEGELADDALFQTALIRKQSGEHREALASFRRLLNEYPTSPHVPRAQWEIAWSLYLTGDFPAAADAFRKLAESPSYREKALYWLGRSRDAAGSRDTAREAYGALREEFPAGYYALNIEKETGIRNDRIPCLSPCILSSLPLPSGYERARTLISLGLREEARMELASIKKRKGSAFRGSLDVAALYLAMDEYRYAMGLFPEKSLQRRDSVTPYTWAILYPAGFRDSVSRHASDAGISEHLTFALIRAESNYSPAALSPVGAVGLMQLMPATAKDAAKGMRESITVSRLHRPDLNIKLGTRHLKGLLVRFNGNVVSAVAAYNAGSTPVLRWRKRHPTLREDEFIESIPYAETREYVKKVMAAAEIYRRLYSPAEASPAVVKASSGVQGEYSSASPANPSQTSTN
jgi:soluble lytic murein transglycosylase